MEFERIERRFTAAEVAELFGVPEATQRDWRRRQRAGEFSEFIEDFFNPTIKGKRVEFSLLEACALALAMVLVEGGKSVAAALWVGKMYSPSVVDGIELAKVCTSIEGIEVSTEERREFIFSSVGQDLDQPRVRYLWFPRNDGLFAPFLPKLDREAGPTAQQFYSLADMEENMSHQWVHGQLFSIEAFAFSLAAKTRGQSIITYRPVEASE